MKYLALLLGLLLQLITCIPCNDTEECTAAPVTATAQTHEQHQHENESCSPFCACNCCATITVFMPVVHPGIPEPKLSVTPLTYITGQESFLSYNEKNIWQPPQQG